MTTDPVSSADALLAAALRGERQLPWPEGLGADLVLDRLRYHGVAGLLHARAAAAGASERPDWPSAFESGCRAEARRQAMWELAHGHALRAAVSALASEQVRPIVFKGTALAYTVYAEPHERARSDTDMFVPESRLAAVDRALRSAGFAALPSAGGEHASYQRSYLRPDPAGGNQAIDLHWRINNAPTLARLFTHDELLARGEPLAALDGAAHGPGLVDAVLLACMHRATHQVHPYHVDGVAHYEGDRLIWLQDLHRLLPLLSPEQRAELGERARDKGLGGICLDGLEAAAAKLGTRIEPDLRAALGRAGGDQATRYLRAGRGVQFAMDLWALGHWRARLGLLRDLVLPDASYMRWRYPERAGTPLAWLYLRRAVGGIVDRARRA